MKNRIFLCCFFTALICYTGNHALFAQSGASHPDKLPWVDGEFPAKRGAFEYHVARGEGATLSGARNDAFSGLLADLGNQAGVTVNSQTIAEIKSSLNYNAGSENYQESTSNVTTHRIDREGFKASFTKVSEYYEYALGRYLLWELYEVSAGAAFTAVIPEYTTHYGGSALWRSMIIPGWGQFHKKKVTKGVIMLTAEVAAISGLAFCELRRSDNWRKSTETTNVNIAKEYRNRADSWELRRNIFVGAAAGVYLWNVLDAAMAKGKLKYAWVPDNLNLITNGSNGYYYCGLSIDF
ncbi:MAG: DUF5683 domain-containing protein [Tannerellaceae bacterium]|jgi:hypothetical protein|nr:DUF5683 domain-containing protein [Tannerellaceae bacterium]